MTPAGVATVFTVPGPATAPGGITAGCDGNVWFVEPWTSQGAAQIGRITPEGEVTEFSPGPGPGIRTPWHIAAGPDGNLCFTEEKRIGRIGAGRLPKPRGLDLPAACPGQARRN